MRAKETVSYLEMTSPGDLRPSREAEAEIEIRQAEEPCPELNRFLYTAIGGDWYWVDRLHWTFDQWLQYVTRPGHETWLAYVAGTPAGYFELDAAPGTDVEIAYFGLLPQFVGRGIGGRLLTLAIQRAWQKGAARVWVHTSSFDHPNALANYRARGFRLFKEEVSYKELPDQLSGPWPGAQRPRRL